MQKLVKLKSKKSKRDIVTNTNNEIISTAFVRNNISQKNTKQVAGAGFGGPLLNPRWLQCHQNKCQ